MGQGWMVIAVECRERWSGQTGCKLGEFFWDWHNYDIVRQLRRPHWEDDIRATAHWSRLPRPQAQTSSPKPRYRLRPTVSRLARVARVSAALPRPKGILSLPVELVHAVFDNLEELLDILNLCLAHEFLGAVGEPLVHKLIAKRYAPWARQKLLCAGHSIRDDDVPPGLERYVAEDIEEFISPEDRDDESRQNRFFSDVAGNLYEGRAGTPGCDFLRWSWPAGALTKADRQKVDQLAEKLRAAERQAYAPKNDEDAQLVLYNLSKRLYVREAPVNELEDRLVTAHDFSHQGIGFAHVLLSQICWSTDSGCAMDVDEERLTRGPWAGDHFEVMYAGKSRARLDSEEWKDVTDDIVPWLEELWRDTWGGLAGL